MLAGTDGAHIGVVMFARECRRGRVPDQCRADAVDFVGSHLLAVSAPAEHDSEARDTRQLVPPDAERRVDAETRVIVEWVEFDRAVVNNVVPIRRTVRHDYRAQFHAGVVGREVDAHGSKYKSQLFARAGAVRYYWGNGLECQPTIPEENMATPDIKRAFRGVDTSQVDESFRALAHEVSALELSVAERNRTIQRLKREIEDPASSTQSFTKLGSAFEETLRTAEEQARRLRSDATVLVSEIKKTTDIEVRNLEEKTEREMRSRVDAATALANDSRLQIERESAGARQQLEDGRARMETNAARTDRSAASLISQAEQQLSDVRAAAHREIVEITRRAAEIVRVASDSKVDAEMRIGVDVSTAQARSTAIHDEADAIAQVAYEQADNHVDAVIAESEALKQEADDQLLSAQIRADQILQDSRGLIQKSISDAMSRSGEITRSTDEFFADFIFDAENSIGEVRRNKLALTDYVAHIRGISNDVNVDAIEAGSARGMRSIQQAEIVEGDK